MPMDGKSSTLPSAQVAAGIGLREPHRAELLARRPSVGFLEVHTENYLDSPVAKRQLIAVRRDYDISLHGVGLSLGTTGDVDLPHLAEIGALLTAIEPCFLSEHLSWSRVDGVYLNDLLPLPYTEEALWVVSSNVRRLQDYFGRRILIENPSAYISFCQSTLSEPEFLNQLVRNTGCGLLLDINNVYVSCRNLGSDPIRYVNELMLGAVEECHVAGHCVSDDLLIDDHGTAVSDHVWELLEYAVEKGARGSVVVEWDRNLPSLAALLHEASLAATHVNRAKGGVVTQ
jgi:uncharacterized protein